MIEMFKAALETLKLSPRKLIASATVFGFLLFAKPEWLDVLGVDGLVKDYRPVIGAGFVLAIGLLITELVVLLTAQLRDLRARRNFKHRTAERLCCLSEDEKQILRFYVAQNTRTNSLRIDDSVVQGLASAGIIFQSASFGNALDGFAFNINQVVWDEIQKDPSLLMGTTNTYRTDRNVRSW